MSVPRRYLPSIPALRALEAVARLGSATAAAEELALTQGAVSRQLIALEEQLGVALIDRRAKRLMLTAPGETYAAEVRAALQQIAQASLKLQSNPGGGAVNLAILPTFGMRWLVPRLPGFARAHPEVTINMTTVMETFNFGAQPFDAAITFGNGDWPDTNKMLLAEEVLVPVAAPGLLAGREIVTARDLLRLPLLHIQTRPRIWQ
ncbi:MAG: LysR family transcriptional regulator, partial [Sphingomonadales bacterium]